MEVMLKLKMIPHKRSKRTRSIPSSPTPSSGWIAEDESFHDKVLVNGERDKLADNLSALLHQERAEDYACVDYLSMTAWHNNMYQLMGRPSNQHTPAAETSRIDEYCREQICEWSYRVVDYFRIDREIVAMSLSYLDRFLCTCNCDRSMFKLAATTALYMAVKVLHPQKLEELGVLSDLSRGEFDMADVSEMEKHMLQALSWRLHPPTAVAIASIAIDYVVAGGLLNVSHDDTIEIKDTASFFGELAVCDYFFVSIRPSTVALASILNALEGVLTFEEVATSRLLDEVGAIHYPVDRQELSAARNRLWELYERSEECALQMGAVVEEEQAVAYGTVSPQQSGGTLSSPVSVNLPYKTTDYFPPSRHKTLQNGSW